MKIKANELDKVLKNEDDDSFLDNFAPAKIEKMHTPDIAEKRKSMAIYKSSDPKRRHKKTF